MLCFVDHSTYRVDPKRYDVQFRSPKLKTRIQNRIVFPASSQGSARPDFDGRDRDRD